MAVPRCRLGNRGEVITGFRNTRIAEVGGVAVWAAPSGSSVILRHNVITANVAGSSLVAIGGGIRFSTIT